MNTTFIFSTYEKESVISKVNNNEPVETSARIYYLLQTRHGNFENYQWRF